MPELLADGPLGEVDSRYDSGIRVGYAWRRGCCALGPVEGEVLFVAFVRVDGCACRVGVVSGGADVVCQLAGRDHGNLVLHLCVAAVDCVSGVVGYRWVAVVGVVFIAGVLDEGWH